MGWPKLSHTKKKKFWGFGCMEEQYETNITVENEEQVLSKFKQFELLLGEIVNIAETLIPKEKLEAGAYLDDRMKILSKKCT